MKMSHDIRFLMTMASVPDLGRGGGWGSCFLTSPSWLVLLPSLLPTKRRVPPYRWTNTAESITFPRTAHVAGEYEGQQSVAPKVLLKADFL